MVRIVLQFSTVAAHGAFSKTPLCNNKKEFPGKMEGGKSVDGEREGLAQTLPECHHLVCFVQIVLVF